MALVPFAIPKFLNNGAEVMAFKKPIRGHMVVLAKTNGYQPYVTWAVDDNGDAYWGHYFATEEQAVADWEKR